MAQLQFTSPHGFNISPKLILNSPVSADAIFKFSARPWQLAGAGCSAGQEEEKHPPRQNDLFLASPSTAAAA